MSNVGYDLDTSGGLMPLIRALIKPPDEDANSQKSKQKPQHPYYKRPGKGHNHDSCDACGEGGDLICCDRCPASFHLGCYDPPLEESDIPAGLWLCKQCRASDEEPGSSRSSRADASEDSNKSVKPKKAKSKDSKDDDSEDGTKEDDQEEDKDLSPMEILVKAAKIMNPKQFELPREMRVPCPFPGTDKEGTNGNVSLVTVDRDGCVPLPAKLCFVCEGTCKMAPLLQCDYCPLLFHQDCLDPPLTALPTGRWMCPNHVEQYIDWKLVNSISASERVALWEQFSGPLDQHAIKIDFIRRARNLAPPFRIKVPASSMGRVMVPDMVRHHYAHPPPLLPSRREYVRCRQVLKNLQSYSDLDASETDESAPKHTICMNVDCVSYKAAGPCPHAPALHTATAEDARTDLQAIKDSKVEHGSDSDSLSDSDLEYLTSPVKRRKMAPPSDRRRGVRLELRAEGGARGEAEARALLQHVEEQLDKLDDRLVKLLAWQRLQQLLTGEQAAGRWRHSGLSARAQACVRRSLDRSRLARHGFRHVQLPSQLLSGADRDRISRAVWGGGGGGGGDSQHAPACPRSPGHSLSDAVLRATLCHVQRPAKNGLGDGLGRPIPMRLSRLSVGADSGCDVVLDARCRHVSRTHATIFYDEVTRHFELINYSEWGSRVNGVLYTCDAALAAPPASPNCPPEDRLNGVLRVRTVGNRRASQEAECTCPRPRPDTGAAWEGSALVPHGALLQFGCQMYVFSITDSSAFPYEQEIDEPAI